ncbi:hypothetical protein [Flavobacterium aquicola]|uniref:Uncharacterized protein n=1 Tax=Flavobacterium aquicola TaxID=1682742 RepID=A0A3E0EMQ7_9FLAO|nr:hypothetical protein [Flavobacterium aquicola]REG99468.1 hypothetical protein C8P67_10486 [Flavobacterium aquicola]
MTSAMKLVIEFSLTNSGLTKTITIKSKQNDGAIKLLERVSFFKTADLENDEINVCL